MARADALLAPYLTHLRALEFVASAEPAGTARPPAEALLVVRTPKGAHRFQVELRRHLLDYAMADQAVRTMEKAGGDWILMTPSVGAPLGRHLASHGVNFVDLQGNLRFRIGNRYLAWIEGRVAPRKAARDKAIRAPGYRVLFALLARPELVAAPLRSIADASGASRQAALDLLARLVQEGTVARTAKGHAWVPGRRRQALDRWIVGYRDVVRPGLLIGMFRTPDRDPVQMQRRLRPLLDGLGAWRWGGTAAGHALTGSYRGTRTVVHLQQVHGDLAREIPQKLKALPDPEGPLVVLGVPGPLALEGTTPDTAHPLLVYSELLVDGSERALDVAAEIRERYLETG